MVTGSITLPSTGPRVKKYHAAKTKLTHKDEAVMLSNVLGRSRMISQRSILLGFKLKRTDERTAKADFPNFLSMSASV
jgi:hypothetical protein